MNTYARTCRECLDKLGRPDVPEGVMEASMRNMYGTLSHLDLRTFRKEAKLAAAMWDADKDACIANARSHGFTA